MNTAQPRDPDGRPLRADAERNRLKVIAAARKLFAERGLDVSMDEVAHHAGVGVGTVYRRFANRDELITGVFAEYLKSLVDRTRGALRGSDPWESLVELITWVGTVMAEDRGLAAVIMRIDPSHPDIESVKGELTDQIEQVFGRAMDAGALRSDVTSTDIFGILTMLSAVAEVMEPHTHGAWRRYLELLLRGIHAAPDTDKITTAPLTETQIRDIQQARAAQRRR